MSIFFWIFISSFLISLISFVGILILFLKERLLERVFIFLVAFAAGALTGSAFLHLIPEAIHQVGAEEEVILKLFLYLLLGFCTVFILEQFISWHHHHTKEHPEIKPFSYLILVSDGIHNFIDGLIIAASFMASLPIGLTTAIAVALHEIPQEMGDFGVLVYSGFKKIKALFLNFLSAITVVLGGIVGFFLLERIDELIIFLLPFAAGSFIYIAASDLIPEIKQRGSFKKSFSYFLIFLAGLGLMLLIKLFVE